MLILSAGGLQIRPSGSLMEFKKKTLRLAKRAKKGKNDVCDIWKKGEKLLPALCQRASDKRVFSKWFSAKGSQPKGVGTRRAALEWFWVATMVE